MATKKELTSRDGTILFPPEIVIKMTIRNADLGCRSRQDLQ